MKRYLTGALLALIFYACQKPAEQKNTGNPILVELNQPIQFDRITPDYIVEAFEQSKTDLATYIDAIVEVPDSTRTFDNTMVKLDDLYDEISIRYSIVYLMGSTHPDSATRETAVKVRADFAKMFNELQLNEDLYKAVKAYSITKEAQSLKGPQAKFVTETVIDYERNGFALELEQREILKDLLNEISSLSNQFAANIANYEDFLILNEDQMKGVSEDFKKGHLQEDGTYKVGLSYPDYIPFMKNAISEDARKQLFFKYNNRAADKNLEVLNNVLIKRKEMAELLGYPTFATYQTETRMAKNPETVWGFESKLTESVRPKGKKDFQELQDYQRSLGIDGNVDPWDKSYLTEELMTNKYGVSEEEVRQYFPIESVKDGLFSITQKLFGLSYKKIEKPSVWHPDVELYEVLDDGELIGRFYLDLHPRSNKYNHAACFPIISSKDKPEGYQIPQASLVCNFTEPTKDKPALMTHDEVETFFHEFGHVLHNMLSKTTLGAQAGTSVSRDFVEAPSQIFENWTWDYESLSLFAKHYETGEVLPEPLFNKMLAAKNVMSGLNTLQQVFYGSYDMTLHDKFDPNGKKTTTEVLEKLQNDITFYDYMPETHFQAAFGHLMGYAASYYGYLWSDVYAQDMFSKFKKEGILSPEVGMAYRSKILARGSEVDEMEMLRDFLGREPNDKAFVESLGLE